MAQVDTSYAGHRRVTAEVSGLRGEIPRIVAGEQRRGTRWTVQTWMSCLLLTLTASACTLDDADDDLGDSGIAIMDAGDAMDAGSVLPDGAMLDAGDADGSGLGDAGAALQPVVGYVVTADSLYLFERSTDRVSCQGRSPCGLNADGKLMRRDLTTGSSNALFADQVIGHQGYAPAVATADRVFFSSGAFQSISVTGGNVSVVDETYDPRYGFVAEDASVYYVSTPIAAPTTGLMRVTATGAPTLVLALPDTLFWGPLAVRAGHVYTGSSCVIEHDRSSEVAWCPQAGVYRASLTSPQLELVVAFPATNPLPLAIAVNDATVVWAASDPTGLSPPTLYAAATTPGATATPLFAASERFSALALDATNVYLCTWDESRATGGHLYQIALANGEARVLADGTCQALQVIDNQLWRLTSGTVEHLAIGE